MAASQKTVEQVLEVVLKYVAPDQVPDMLEELKDIPGNASFVETIRRLHETGTKPK